MRHSLQPHPDFPCKAVSSIEVDVSRGLTGTLLLHYYVNGNPKRLVPSPWTTPGRRRADELWLHTCFEAFVRPAGSEAYLEFNVAPNFDWQAYRLGGYRRDRQPADDIDQPAIEGRLMGESYELRVYLPLTDIVPNAVPWQLGLSAVIEDKDGATSYWALQHAPGKPDFHHASAFALELPVTP
jgi:hypothetical protein